MRPKRYHGHLGLQYLRTEDDAFIAQVRSGWSMIPFLSSVPPSPSPPFQGFAGATDGDELAP